MTTPTLPVHTLNVSGMTCGHCEQAVVRAVKLLDPQAQVQADRTQNRVVIHSTQGLDALVAAIAEEGYTVGTAP